MIANSVNLSNNYNSVTMQKNANVNFKRNFGGEKSMQLLDRYVRSLYIVPEDCSSVFFRNLVTIIDEFFAKFIGSSKKI